MIGKLLGLHKHPSTKNLDEYKQLKKTRSFVKDFLAHSKALVLRTQDVIDSNASCFTPLNERGLTISQEPENAMAGEAYVGIAQDTASLNTMRDVMNKAYVEKVMRPIAELAEHKFTEMLEAKRDELNDRKDMVDKGMESATKAMKKKSLSPDEIQRVQDIARASQEHLAALNDMKDEYTKGLHEAQLETDMILLKGIYDFFEIQETYHRTCCDLLRERIPELESKLLSSSNTVPRMADALPVNFKPEPTFTGGGSEETVRDSSLAQSGSSPDSDGIRQATIADEQGDSDSSGERRAARESCGVAADSDSEEEPDSEPPMECSSRATDPDSGAKQNMYDKSSDDIGL